MSPRLFVGVYPTGLVYADRRRERSSDYSRLAFLPHRSLTLEVETDCPPELRTEIVRIAAEVQARRGEAFTVSACGHTVQLGTNTQHPEPKKAEK